jgi:hypothetical protein
MDQEHYWEAVLSVFQFSMGPSALALTLGMILGALTNRFQFLMTNLRRMAHDIRHEKDLTSTLQTGLQIVMLQSRVRTLQASMLSVGFSILMLASLIGLLFLERLLLWRLYPVTILLFLGILGTMILGVSLFLVDVRQAHKALDIEIQGAMEMVSRKVEMSETHESQVAP